MDIIEGLRNRDEAALRSLIEQYGDYLFRSAYLLVQDRQTAEEVVQDTFITAYRKIDQLMDPAGLRSWLTRIAVNRCRMRQRTWQWRNLFPSEDVEELITEEVEPGPLDELLITCRNASLSEAIRRLDYKYREAITLFYYNELSVREIAAELRTSENTIKSRLSRGRALLKTELSKEGVTDASGAGSRASTSG